MENTLKENIKKHKFLIIIVALIFCVIGYQGYKTLGLFGVDRGSYVVEIRGEVTYNGTDIETGERTQVEEGGIIETLTDESIAVIEWGEGSITRLGPNSHVVVNEASVDKNLSEISISFDLVGGKTWSNVVSFLGEESHFIQNFQDIEASVRGTVFDVDLEKEYIFVQDHEVSVKKGEETAIIPENRAFNFTTFSYIEITDFINNIQDKAWREINQGFDTEYLNMLREEVLNGFSKINLTESLTKTLGEQVTDLDALEKTIASFSAEKKKDAYNALLGEYQKYNFINASDTELFSEKLIVKKLLLSVAGEENKTQLMKYSLYDLQDAIEAKNIDAIKSVLPMIDQYKENISDLDIKKLFDGMNFGVMPENMQNIIGDHIETFKSLLDPAIFENILGKSEILQDAANPLLDKAVKDFGNAKEQVTDIFNSLTK